MFTVGRGVKRNYATAIEWFTKAANAGYASGQFYLGDMFEKGRGVKRDKRTAVNWYKKAGDQGHQEAINRRKRLVR
jgi:TPR repeat protein